MERGDIDEVGKAEGKKGITKCKGRNNKKKREIKKVKGRGKNKGEGRQ